MKRRDFIRAASSIGLSSLLPWANLRADPNCKLVDLIDTDSDRVLILIQLFGGNDGLNTLVPLDQYYALSQVRDNLVMPESSLLGITDTLALHPSMSGLQEMFQSGTLGVIQNVGYEIPNRSHFRSTDVWNSGSESESHQTSGWIGRYLSGEYSGYPIGYPNSTCPHPPAVSIGKLAHPSCQGDVMNLSQTVDPNSSIMALANLDGAVLPDDNFGYEMNYLRTMTSVTNDYGQALNNALAAGSNTVSYPGSWIARQLKTVAQLISGGLQSKVYTIRMDGFDTHAAQVSGDGTGGNHAYRLQELSEGIRFFHNDIEGLGLSERVMGLTYSEFGRRIRSNHSRGSDHGAANMMFFFGPCVDNQVIGDNPIIDPMVGQSDDLPMRIDFRDVYASVLKDWFHVSDSRISNILYPDFNYIPLMGLCGAALPVDIFDFTVTAKANTAFINWRTGNEIDNKGFEVQVSQDGRNFKYFHWAPGDDGTEPGRINDYEATDGPLVVGQRYYYRIKSVAFNGDEKYSPIRSVIITGKELDGLYVSAPFPNPSSDIVSFNCQSSEDGSVSLAMYDESGRQVYTDAVTVIGGANSRVSIRLKNIAAGSYHVRFSSAKGETLTKAVIVN